MISMRLPWWGVFSFYNAITSGIVPTIIHFLMQTVAYVQNMGNIMIAINRVTSIAMPHSYERVGFWINEKSKKKLKLDLYKRIMMFSPNQYN